MAGQDRRRRSLFHGHESSSASSEELVKDNASPNSVTHSLVHALVHPPSSVACLFHNIIIPRKGRASERPSGWSSWGQQQDRNINFGLFRSPSWTSTYTNNAESSSSSTTVGVLLLFGYVAKYAHSFGVPSTRHHHHHNTYHPRSLCCACRRRLMMTFMRILCQRGPYSIAR